jgi:hypothetical protein
MHFVKDSQRIKSYCYGFKRFLNGFEKLYLCQVLWDSVFLYHFLDLKIMWNGTERNGTEKQLYIYLINLVFMLRYLWDSVFLNHHLDLQYDSKQNGMEKQFDIYWINMMFMSNLLHHDIDLQIYTQRNRMERKNRI